MTPIETLRAASRHLRTEESARPIARLIADWLDAEARSGLALGDGEAPDFVYDDATKTFDAALKVADLVLGGDA